MPFDAHSAVLRTFRWQKGRADVWRIFADGAALAAVIEGLVAPWRAEGVTRVVGIEARGFLLGGACAVELGVGFVPIRKHGGLLPGPTVTVRTEDDYRKNRSLLRMQRVVNGRDRVLLVDDWAERGSQARAARALVEEAGASYLGLALIVDQLDDAGRRDLTPVTSIVTATELGTSS